MSNLPSPANDPELKPLVLPNCPLPLPVSRRGPRYNTGRLSQSDQQSQPVPAQALVYALASLIRTSLSALARPKACVNARARRPGRSIEPNQESSRPHPRYAQRQATPHPLRRSLTALRATINPTMGPARLP